MFTFFVAKGQDRQSGMKKAIKLNEKIYTLVGDCYLMFENYGFIENKQLGLMD